MSYYIKWLIISWTYSILVYLQNPRKVRNRPRRNAKVGSRKEKRNGGGERKTAGGINLYIFRQIIKYSMKVKCKGVIFLYLLKPCTLNLFYVPTVTRKECVYCMSKKS